MLSDVTNKHLFCNVLTRRPNCDKNGLFALGVTDFLKVSLSTQPKVGKKTLQIIKIQLKEPHTLKKAY